MFNKFRGQKTHRKLSLFAMSTIERANPAKKIKKAHAPVSAPKIPSTTVVGPLLP
jgi:hypothetical protein